MTLFARSLQTRAESCSPLVSDFTYLHYSIQNRPQVYRHDVGTKFINIPGQGVILL